MVENTSAVLRQPLWSMQPTLLNLLSTKARASLFQGPIAQPLWNVPVSGMAHELVGLGQITFQRLGGTKRRKQLKHFRGSSSWIALDGVANLTAVRLGSCFARNRLQVLGTRHNVHTVPHYLSYRMLYNAWEAACARRVDDTRCLHSVFGQLLHGSSQKFTSLDQCMMPNEPASVWAFFLAAGSFLDPRKLLTTVLSGPGSKKARNGFCEWGWFCELA